jgi:hypothetical protein
MPTNLLTPKQKKLKNLRTILCIVFTTITVTILLVGSLSVPAALLINKTSNLSSLVKGETGMLLLSLIAVLFVKVAVIGIICLVTYAIFKYRLEKDDDLFL